MCWRLGSIIALAAMLWASCTQAQTGCIPNPNATFPYNAAVNGCNMPASGFNNIGAGSQTPNIYGAKCDGVTDDRLALQQAVSALQGTGRALFLSGICATSTQISISAPIEILGQNMGNRIGVNQYAGFVPLTQNQTILNLSAGASGSRIHDFAIFAGPKGIPTSGSWIVINGGYDIKIERIFAMSPCGFIDLQTGNLDVIEENVINNLANTGCVGIKIGSLSTGANTVGPLVLHNLIASSSGTPPDAGIAIYDSGGATLIDNDVLYSTWGTKIIPGAGQIVQWATFTGDISGDTNISGDLLIDPQASSGIVRGLEFTGSWTSNASSGPPLTIQNTGAGTINGLHFVGHRFYANGNNDVAHINAGTNIEFDSSQFCLGTGTGIGASVGAAVVSASFRNSIFGNCNGSVAGAGTTPAGTGISQASASTRLVITNNNFISSSTPLSLPANPTLDLIEHNQGLDETNAGTVPSAATIALPPNKLIPISGTTTVTTMNGFWPNRSVILMPGSSGLAFNTGGNLCNSVTSTANVAILAVYALGANCWTLK